MFNTRVVQKARSCKDIYQTASFLGYGRAEDMKRSIVNVLSSDSLSMVKMLHLGCDGCNVNKSLKKHFE